MAWQLRRAIQLQLLLSGMMLYRTFDDARTVMCLGMFPPAAVVGAVPRR